MDFNEYQEKARKTDLGHEINYYFLGLTEEAGEVAGKRKRYLRDEGKIDREDLCKELGDVLWYTSQIADKYNISLKEVAEMNIIKLEDRKKRGVLKGIGDNR
ncbi:nucleoside triphosphate pyrophosphohydrolase family protein [bacterium]|jgi:NTP pyrophosphatase (non-canonical NTP hydrolase)|nr:nucleoside triphosphate pyrophosphohydrolase family protein [bacterium]